MNKRPHKTKPKPKKARIEELKVIDIKRAMMPLKVKVKRVMLIKSLSKEERRPMNSNTMDEKFVAITNKRE
jgi:hypothetical protein